MPLQRLSNSCSNDYSWVEIGVRIDAPQTSKSHNFWFDHWIFEFHTFLETKNQDISKGVKISLIRGGLTMAAASIFAPRAINSPKHALDRGHTFFWNLPSAQLLSTFSLSPKHQKSPKNTPKKAHQNLLIIPFSPRIQGIAFALNLPFLGSTLWIWGLRVWMHHFSYHPHP